MNRVTLKAWHSQAAGLKAARDLAFDLARPCVGYFYLTGVAADADVVTIGGRVYEFDTAALPGTITAGHVLVSVTADQTADASITALVAAINGDTSAVVDAVAWTGNTDVSSGCSFVARVSGVQNYAMTITCANGVLSAATMVGNSAATFLGEVEYTVTAQDVTTLALAAGNSVIVGAKTAGNMGAPRLCGLVCRTSAGVVKVLATVQVLVAQVNSNHYAVTVDDGGAVLATGDVIGFYLSQ